MKSKLFINLLFIVSVGSGWLYGIEHQPTSANDGIDEACSFVDRICSYLGFSQDAYGKIWSNNCDEKEYKSQISCRFKKAKICAVNGMPMLLCGAITLERTTGSSNPLALILADDSSGSFQECNNKLNGQLNLVTRFVNHPDSGKYIIDLRNLHKEACEAQFPQTESFSFSSHMPESLSVCSALAMMVNGGYLTASSLIHLGSGLFGVCYMGYCSVFKKTAREKVD